MPSPTTPVASDSTPSSSPSSSKRRSARVHKRDPIVAPGFGTQKDLNNLSTSLGLPVPAVQAMMESRGRGIRRRAAGDGDVDDGDEQTQPPAPINNAWADFMMEEGMTVTEEQDEQEPTQTASAAAAAAAANSETKTAKTTASSSTSPREYALPLEASWNIKKDLRPKKKLKTTPTSSVLVQTGTLDAGMIGRTKRPLDKPYDLSIPTIISPSLKVTKVIAGCNAAHAICIANDAVVYGWGRNEALQLSQSLPQMVPLPTKLPIEDVTIVDGAVGKFHTILLDSNYKLHAVGSNKCGQCGVNSSVDSVPNIRKCPLDGVNIVQVSCGEQFTVALSDEGRIYTTGSSEFGQLGNGETGEYFLSANKLAFANATTFTLQTTFCHAPGETSSNMTSDLKVVPMNQDIRIGYIACGKHHTVAIEAPSDHPPRLFSWGCGNYGCLGHGPQKDEYRPRLISTLSSGPIWDANPAVSAAAGAICSLILTKRGHVYYCGRHRSVGEAVMRPSLLEALANNGHVVEHVSAGSGSVVCSTKNAVTISWGQGPHGELGYGEKKSSAKPDFVTSLDKCRVRGLACGQGTTLFLVAEEDEEDKTAIKQLKVLDPEDVEELEIE